MHLDGLLGQVLEWLIGALHQSLALEANGAAAAARTAELKLELLVLAKLGPCYVDDGVDFVHGSAHADQELLREETRGVILIEVHSTINVLARVGKANFLTCHLVCLLASELARLHIGLLALVMLSKIQLH